MDHRAARQAGYIHFGVLLLNVLELFALRETNVKDVCVELANDGLIENTWKSASKKKPYDGSPITLSKARQPA
jgi:hypothetical protein